MGKLSRNFKPTPCIFSTLDLNNLQQTVCFPYFDKYGTFKRGFIRGVDRDHQPAAEGFEDHAVASVLFKDGLGYLNPWAKDTAGCGFGHTHGVAVCPYT